MRHRYFHLDPELLRSLLAGLDLQRLFNRLLLSAGGDVDEAMEWMRYLQKQGYIDESIDLEAFFADLEQQRMIERDQDGSLVLSAVGERRIRKGAFEEVFKSLHRGGVGYHPVRASGEGAEKSNLRTCRLRPWYPSKNTCRLTTARTANTWTVLSWSATWANEVTAVYKRWYVADPSVD